jgi:CheY-like chemotaxis protein
MSSVSSTCRVLLVDDNVAIHADLRKVLASQVRSSALSELEQSLFGKTEPLPAQPPFEATYADNGEDACRKLTRAGLDGHPFTIAVIDMRMPGWDGVETAEQLLHLQPDLEIAITSAYMDYSWNEVIARLQRPSLRLIPKPWSSGKVLSVLHELRTRVLSRQTTVERQRAGSRVQ